ncbi:MAG: DUF4157 domain-containing protein [Chitinophaga sp.]|uniref:eCIS core domain-containing protein n=1 Tax=Chitinophaga sp. TaxID=1869181 RepID=UPI0025BCD876|nr:DUF4157 domain-containing protein [Chitinophaga sp.]MBV8255952.1 DUF4157 domain-containing protein [Chitinophaga sp.]
MSEHANATKSSHESVPAAEAVAASQSAMQLKQEASFSAVRMPIQFKLSLGAVDDPQEAEADAMADKVMNMQVPAAAPISASPVTAPVQRKCAACEQPAQVGSALILRKCAQCEEEKLHRSPEPSIVQRKCAHCEDEEKKGKLQMKPLAAVIRRSGAGEATSTVSSEVSAGIGATRGQGSGMSDNTKHFMESRFGADFSDVRIHTGDYAANLSRDLNAQAFTVGNDIYFNNGKYSPETDGGRRLLAHELTHTLQQGASGPDARRKPGSLPISSPVIRRAPDKSSGTTDGPVKYNSWREGNATITRNITRKSKRCQCAGTSNPLTGWFYNPDLRNLALVFSYCKGSTRVDAYTKLKDNIPEVIVSGKKVQTTGAVGATVTFPIGKETAQVTAEAKGTNVGAGTGPGAIPSGVPGAGFHLDVNLGLGRIGKQPFRLDTQLDYTHFWNIPNVKNPNLWDFKLGAQVGDNSIFGNINQTGDLPRSYNLMYELRFGKIKTPQKPDCVNGYCICPPPIVEYICEDTKQEDDTQPKTPDPAPPEDFLHYFKYFTTDEPDDAELQAQNKTNLDAVQNKVKDGYSVQYVRGYASPEGKEKEINEKLGEDRGKKFQGMVTKALSLDTPVPLSKGTGELLGFALNNNPDSHLVDVIKEYGVQSAQDLSTHLQGKEFGTNKDLTREFLQLFKTVTKPEDRLRIFGLSTGTKLGQRVLTAIDAFVASEGQGERPWEAFFQMYRIALVRLQKPTPPAGKPEHHAATKEKVAADKCKESGLDAESKNLFGKPPAPTGDESQVASECNNDNRTEGCDYSTPPDPVDKKILPPPDGAPKQIK